MKPEEKMQKVVEAAGECWHKYRTTQWCGKDDVTTCLWCVKCGLYENDSPNPSPTDLNALFRLADKLAWECAVEYRASFIKGQEYRVIITKDAYAPRSDRILKHSSNRAEALLNALYETTI